MEVNIPRKVRLRVAERIRLGLCLVCDSKAVKRQLCQCHYDQYINAVKCLPSKKAKLHFERRAREAGDVLGAYELREYKGTNRFAKYAKGVSE